MDRWQVWKSEADGQWYFRRLAGNNEPVGHSEGYTQEHNALEEARRQANEHLVAHERKFASELNVDVNDLVVVIDDPNQD